METNGAWRTQSDAVFVTFQGFLVLSFKGLKTMSMECSKFNNCVEMLKNSISVNTANASTFLS